MKRQFVQCEFCKAEMPAEACNLASHRAVIEGKEYTFCCAKCAERFIQKRKK